MRAFALSLGSAAPLGLNKCVPIISPRLCRSIALTRLLYVFQINIFYYFDAVVLFPTLNCRWYYRIKHYFCENITMIIC